MKKIIFVLLALSVLGIGAFYFRNAIFRGEEGSLKIVMSTKETDLSPYGLNLNNATRIQNIYEGLVAFGPNLKIIPSLAVSWGNTGENEWEFRLRQGVKFHDGSSFGPQDVLDAFQKAKDSNNNQIAVYISTIREMRQTEDGRIVVTTQSPDPLLLSKLTKLFIYHEGQIGTGPYRLDEWIPGSVLSLVAFPDYWGEKPVFPKARYEVIDNRAQRKTDFEEGEIDLLVGLTEEQALTLPPDQVITNYGLEVNFLMFQLDDPVFMDKNIRKAIQTLFDPAQIEGIGNHFVRSTSQFIAPGVFGYNPQIPPYAYAPDKEARDLFGGRLERVNFYFLSAYGTLTDYLMSQMREAGFSVKGNVVEPGVLLEKIQNLEAPMFLIGWQSEDGDAGGFFDAFIHSDGPFNNGRYSNPAVDLLIEQARTEMDPQKRLLLLQEIGAKVNEDVIGIPLFETSRLFGIKRGLQWEPRLDGLVLASEVRK